MTLQEEFEKDNGEIIAPYELEEYKDWLESKVIELREDKKDYSYKIQEYIIQVGNLKQELKEAREVITDMNIEIDLLRVERQKREEAEAKVEALLKAEDLASYFLQGEVNQLQSKLKAIEDALIELVQVKEWKDKYGKDEHYLKSQPIAWENAKEALKELKK